MDLIEFSQVMAARGCVGDKRTFCGSYNGMPFSAVFVNGKPGGNSVISLQVLVSSVVKNKVAKVAAAPYKYFVKIVPPAQRPNRNMLCLNIITKNSADFTATFDGLVASLPAVLASFGLNIPVTCPLCGAHNPDSFAHVNGAYIPTHANCVHAMAATKHAEVDANQRQGNYALGILGAILGAILGNLPNILAILLFERTYVILFALIPLASYYGYKLLGGVMSNATFWIVSVFSILFAPLTDFGTV